ncbi:recombinase family protein [uncultured Pantoea sp.]|uniref:recombinase family protein n=1 Tax=uncultured Pantoea sp. TaxID=218084 RepID=UPI00258A904A|nr:recombinase family protein [uncultured Pantoea sp.]
MDEQLSRINSYIESKPELKNGELTHWQDIGLSAYKNKNIVDGELGKIVQLVESGDIGVGHYLVIYSLDRLSRRSSWDEDTIQKIVKSGVVIHDVSTPVIINKDEPFSKILMELIISRVNNESKIKSERSIAGWEKRLTDTLKDGKVFTKKLPRWLSTDDNGYTLITEQVDIINRIFTEYTNGLTSPMIARRLNEEGIKSTGSSLWRLGTITKLIKDERLRGKLKRNSDGTLIPNVFPEVIGEEIFKIANDILKVNSAGTKGRPRENEANREVHNILTGMIRCGKCGSRVTTSKNTRDVRYVVCRNRLNFRTCGQGSKRLDLLEKTIISHIKQIDLTKVLSQEEFDTSKETKLKVELIALEADAELYNQKIKKRKEDKLIPSLPYAEALTEIEDRIQEIKNKLSQAQPNEPLVDIKEFDIAMLMDYENVELRMSLRKLLLQVVDRITFRSIDDKNLVEIKYNRDTYRHVFLLDKKLTEVEHEISINKIGNVIEYTTDSFKIVEHLEDAICTFSNIMNAKTEDYIILAGYINGLAGKSWIADIMYHPDNLKIVTSN